MVKGCSNKNKLKWKVFLLIAGILMLGGMMFLQQHRKEKRNKEYKTSVEQKKVPSEEDELEVERKGTQKQREETQEIRITNLDEYAAELMGENAELLNESLKGWVEEHQLNVKEGIIFHVMVPKSNPQSINFYVRLLDESRSLVLLSYHPRENVVTAAICNYTEKEVRKEVWEGDNGPARRDVPADKDTGGKKEQEDLNDTAGED